MTRMFKSVTRTWNPVVGCWHNCTYCWAKELSATKLKHLPRYRDGFEPKLIDNEFKQRFKPGEFVFVTDMGDLFGSWVPRKWIEAVLGVVKKFPDTKFLFQTKNPERFGEFVFPVSGNIYLGTSIETNRDYGLTKAPTPWERHYWMTEYKSNPQLLVLKKFLSIEPICDFDLDRLVHWVEAIGPDIIEVGADNHGHSLPEPCWDKVEKLLYRLRGICGDVKAKEGLERLKK